MLLPFLSAYDPKGEGEGTLDPLGLYQIADQLAIKLVPAVRERMQRIRFLTAMAVGTRVTAGMSGSYPRDVSPQLAWEWLVVEAFVRSEAQLDDLQGVAGVQVVRRASRTVGCVDAATYLKTPRIFGFHGVYKRLALHIGVTDVHLNPGAEADRLMEAWASGLEGGASTADRLVKEWTRAVKRSLEADPPHTAPGWSSGSWADLASALQPTIRGAKERRVLRELLHADDPARALGALPQFWALLDGAGDDTPDEKRILATLARRHPHYGPLCAAIGAYERFARAMQDAFDALRVAASRTDTEAVSDLARHADVVRIARMLPAAHEAATDALGQLGLDGSLQVGLFAERFAAFAEPMTPTRLASALLQHHEQVQRGKSDSGKRTWFEGRADDRVYLRPQYRMGEWEARPDGFVHAYRSAPIARFKRDLQ